MRHTIRTTCICLRCHSAGALFLGVLSIAGLMGLGVILPAQDVVAESHAVRSALLLAVATEESTAIPSATPPSESGMMLTVTPTPTATITPTVAPTVTLTPPESAGVSVFLPAIGYDSGLYPGHPDDAATGQSANVYLAWRYINATLPSARFDLYLEADDASPDQAIAAGLEGTTFAPTTLAVNTRYYWQVVAVGSDGRRLEGPIWSFQTEPVLDPPPVGAMVSIPAGEFLMGCDANNNSGSYGCADNQQPLHAAWLDAYAIDKYEVTNSQYRACVDAGACDPPRRVKSWTRDHYYDDATYDLYPVLYVSWWNAQDYCHWVGKRLPTEAEWEKAARGPVDTRIWPWGNEDPDCTRVARNSLEGAGSDTCPKDTVRVGQYPRGASPYGVMDLSGNAFEWVADVVNWSYYSVAPYENPAYTPSRGQDFIIRGGSFRDQIWYMRVFNRHFGHHGDVAWEDRPYFRNHRVGFRCARTLGTP